MEEHARIWKSVIAWMSQSGCGVASRRMDEVRLLRSSQGMEEQVRLCRCNSQYGGASQVIEERSEY